MKVETLSNSILSFGTYMEVYSLRHNHLPSHEWRFNGSSLFKLPTAISLKWEIVLEWLETIFHQVLVLQLLLVRQEPLPTKPFSECPFSQTTGGSCSLSSLDYLNYKQFTPNTAITSLDTQIWVATLSRIPQSWDLPLSVSFIFKDKRSAYFFFFQKDCLTIRDFTKITPF